MNVTKIFSPLFDSRLKEIDLYDSQPGEIQQRVLKNLLQKAANTEWGKIYDYKSINNYNEYKELVSVQTYENVTSYEERMRNVEQTLLWPH